MNDLNDLIEKIVVKKINEKQPFKHEKAVVTAVREDYLRAAVRFAGGSVYELLNKTSEKLYVGDTVWVEYKTLPSSGYIAVRNGEADPLKEGGGAGGTIEHAAIITADDSEIVVEREKVDLYVGQRSTAYYGSRQNKFYLNNGLVAVMKVGSSTGEIIQMFEDGILTVSDLSTTNVGLQLNGVMKYIDMKIYSISKSNSSTAVGGYYISYSPRCYDSADPDSYFSINFGLTASESTRGPSCIGFIYGVESITANSQYVSGSTRYETPYGYVSGNLYAVALDQNGKYYANSVSNNSLISRTWQKFNSQAEYDFAMNIITRSELIDNG